MALVTLFSKTAHSVNTVVLVCDYFWPFFANYSYEEIMTLVLDVLVSSYAADELLSQTDVPEHLLESFGESCRQGGLVDEKGIFDDPYKLVRFFCGK